MCINGAKIAAAISLLYVLHVLNTAIETALTGVPVSVIWFVLKQPQPLGTTIVCLLSGFGLWCQYRWAWWLAITAATIQLGRIAEFWVNAPSIATENLFSQAIVVSFLIVISLPNTRKLCIRSCQIRA